MQDMGETMDAFAQVEQEIKHDTADLSKWVTDAYNELELLVHRPDQPHREDELIRIEGQSDILAANIYICRGHGWVRLDILCEGEENFGLEAELDPEGRPDCAQGPQLLQIATILESCRAALESSGAESSVTYNRN